MIVAVRNLSFLRFRNIHLCGKAGNKNWIVKKRGKIIFFQIWCNFFWSLFLLSFRPPFPRGARDHCYTFYKRLLTLSLQLCDCKILRFNWKSNYISLFFDISVFMFICSYGKSLISLNWIMPIKLLLFLFTCKTCCFFFRRLALLIHMLIGRSSCADVCLPLTSFSLTFQFCGTLCSTSFKSGARCGALKKLKHCKIGFLQALFFQPENASRVFLAEFMFHVF